MADRSTMANGLTPLPASTQSQSVGHTPGDTKLLRPGAGNGAVTRSSKREQARGSKAIGKQLLVTTERGRNHGRRRATDEGQNALPPATTSGIETAGGTGTREGRTPPYIRMRVVSLKNAARGVVISHGSVVIGIEISQVLIRGCSCCRKRDFIFALDLDP